MNDDIIACLIRDAIRADPRTGDTLRALEPRWRSTWGGMRWYVQERPAQVKALAIEQAVNAGQPVRVATVAVGVSQSTAYRYGFDSLGVKRERG